MYQVEVKYLLVKHLFSPSDGWRVIIDIDSMERGEGEGQAPDKVERARLAEAKLRSLGVTIDKHPQFGRADVVAQHSERGLWLVEVEGTAKRQKEQAPEGASHVFGAWSVDTPNEWRRRALRHCSSR